MFSLFSKKKVIVTHSGDFHADDIFACAALSLFLKDKIKIIRTRDNNKIEKGDYVLDVGGVYDPAKNRFDHHQTGGAGKRENGIPYAAFGLVWKHFGKEVSGSEQIAQYIDIRLAQPIDAVDNGVPVEAPLFPGVHQYTPDNMFEVFIPFFRERDKKIDKIFEKLVDFAKEVLVNEIKQAKAVEADEKAVMTAYEVSADKRVIVLDQGHDWKYVLNKYPEPLYVIHPRSDGVWQVATVRDDPRTFKQRKDLPAGWAGLTDEKLAKVTGVPDAIFCHRNLFLAVAKTKAGALKLAEIALHN